MDMAEQQSGASAKWIAPLIGFLAGAVFLRVTDELLPHLDPRLAVRDGPRTSW
jgi:hypothetical protein